MPLLVLILVWTGCEGQRPGQKSGASLTVAERSICLKKGPQENCKQGVNRVFRLSAEKGRLRLQGFEMEIVNHPGNWVSFGDGKKLSKGKYKVKMEGGSILMEGESGKFKSPRNVGFLVQFHPKRGAKIFQPKKQEVPLHKIDFGKRRIAMDGIDYGSALLMTSMPIKDKSGSSVMMSVVLGDEESRIRMNDTGTEIILDDVFRALNCCEYAKKLKCCDGGGTGKSLIIPAQPMIQPPASMAAIQKMGNYFPEPQMASSIISGSWKTIMTIVAADVCLYRSGGNLIIYDCATGDVYCLDSSECIILLESNEEGEIAVMVKEECDVFDSLEPCR